MGSGWLIVDSGNFKRGKGERGKGKELLPMPNAQCPMPNAHQQLTTNN
ncbi:hypothetical protein H6G81_22970 [Scytonema hofmannii FACHB-248]|uniref:Uncharacterized protein n=1 Tax=Scytonema hofmannii FACHB-248 TaxID=1842502 RepID=A0ABR8GVX8_9CYAN|nr:MULTISPECIES: hypothetical protein [Nostocales]MBD2607313.1 hypothetical protein [Scytonema hofmannii FACHB-248]